MNVDLNTLVPLLVLFLTAYLLSKAYLVTEAAQPIIERMSRHIGERPEQILFGFMSLVAAFSLFLPNVIAALAFAPLIPSVLDRFSYASDLARKRLGTAFALATIWGANIGGMGSLTGGVSNPILLIYASTAGVPGAEKINFLTWFFFGIPISATLLLIAWVVMRVGLAKDFGATHVHDRVATMVQVGGVGAARTPHHEMTAEHKRLYLFTAGFLAFWILHSIAEQNAAAYGKALGGAAAQLLVQGPMVGSVLFGLWFIWWLMVPRGADGYRMLPWRAALDLPWRGIALIVVSTAVSLALIHFFEVGKYASALARWAHDAEVPDILILFGVMMMVGIATEFLNNVVVALAFFPIIHQVSSTLGFEPMPLLVAVSLMSTAPFVLPTGAPSNALVIGETRGFQYDIALKLGLMMMLLSGIVMTLFGMYFIPRVLGF